MHARNVVSGAAGWAFLVLLAFSPPPAQSRAENPQAAGDSTGKIASTVKPKDLSPSTTKGLAYLGSQQHASGGWGQGGGWRQNL